MDVIARLTHVDMYIYVCVCMVLEDNGEILLRHRGRFVSKLLSMACRFLAYVHTDSKRHSTRSVQGTKPIDPMHQPDLTYRVYQPNAFLAPGLFASQQFSDPSISFLQTNLSSRQVVVNSGSLPLVDDRQRPDFVAGSLSVPSNAQRG